MVIRRFLFSWVCLLASSLFMYGQMAVKTNVAMDAVAIPNLGVEVGLSKKLTVDIPFYYNPWKYSDNKMLKLVMVQPELRYWLCDKFNGHFFGFHLMGGAYNTTGIDLPFSPFYNPQIQISAESETKRSIFREKDKTKRSKKESAQHSKSRNKSFVMTSVSAL